MYSEGGKKYEVMYVKSINVKRIAALAGALLIAGAGVAAATLTFGNTMLVDETGAPRVNVVVGENAAASDGVAAARIAATIASSAYQTKTYTPVVTGGTCGTGEEAGEGSCSVLDEWVILKFTAPGLTGAYEFEANIHDYLDRQLMNRINDEAGGDDEYEYADGDLTWDDANPYTDGAGAFVGDGVDEQATLRVDGIGFTPFADYTVSYPASAEKTFTEKQALWIVGDTKYDTSEDDLVADIDFITYGVMFYGSDYGIPTCAKDDDGDDNWADCVDGAGDWDNDWTGEKRVKVKFLGDEWIITDIDPDDCGPGGLDDEDMRESCGKVTLAKEADRRIMQLGDVIGLSAGYELKLTDIGVAETEDNAHAALFDIIDSTTGEVIDDEDADVKKIFPGDTEEWEIPGTDDTVRVHVYVTTYGYELFQRWAEVAVYAEEWELNNNDEVENDNANDEWTSVLIWKNKDASAAEDDADSLRSILFYTEEYNNDDIELEKGDSVPVIYEPDTQVYTLAYNGLDLTSDDYEELEFSYDDDLDISVNKFCDAHAKVEGARAILIQSGDGSHKLFDPTVPGTYGTTSGNTPKTYKIYVLIDQTTAAITDAELVDINEENSGRLGEIYIWNEAGDGCYEFAAPDAGDTGAATLTIEYDTAGRADGEIEVVLDDFTLDANGTVTGDLDDLQFTITENAGDIDTTESTDGIHFHYDIVNDRGFDLNTNGEDDDEFEYTAVNDGAGNIAALAEHLDGEHFEPKDLRYTDRGSMPIDFEDEHVKFDIAKKVGLMQFSFSTTEEAAEPDSRNETLREGESTVVGGVTVEVKEIGETLSTCTVGAGGDTGCVFNNDAVATINGEATLSVNEANPAAVNPSSLIMLDSETSGTGSVVSVGGPSVNTVTQQLLTGVTYDFSQSAVIMEVEGTGSIVVAGKEKEDTLNAAMDFIAQLS